MAPSARVVGSGGEVYYDSFAEEEEETGEEFDDDDGEEGDFSEEDFNEDYDGGLGLLEGDEEDYNDDDDGEESGSDESDDYSDGEEDGGGYSDGGGGDFPTTTITKRPRGSFLPPPPRSAVRSNGLLGGFGSSLFGARPSTSGRRPPSAVTSGGGSWRQRGSIESDHDSDDPEYRRRRHGRDRQRALAAADRHSRHSSHHRGDTSDEEEEDSDDDDDDSDHGGGGHRLSDRYYATYGKLRKVQSEMQENRRWKKLRELQHRLRRMQSSNFGFLADPTHMRTLMREAGDALARNPNLTVADLMSGRGLSKDGTAAMEQAQKPPKEIFAFNPTRSMNFGMFLFLGHTNTGKTTALIDILYYKRHYFKQALVFSGSQKSAQLFRKFIPASFVRDRGFDPLALRLALLRQRLDVVRGVAKPLLIIIDDCAHQKDLYMRCPEFMYACKNGRHDNVCIMITMQYYTDLTPEFRNQAMYVFIQREMNRKYLEVLFEAYNTCFDSFDEFNTAMEMCTKDHGTMVLSHDENVTADFSSRVFAHRSKPNRHFKLDRHGAMWKYHKRWYDPDVEEKTLVEEIKEAQLQAVARAMGVSNSFDVSKKGAYGGGGMPTGSSGGANGGGRKGKGGGRGGSSSMGGLADLFPHLEPSQLLAMMQIAMGNNSGVDDPLLRSKGIDPNYFGSLGMLTGGGGGAQPTIPQYSASGLPIVPAPPSLYTVQNESSGVNLAFKPGQLYKKRRPHHDAVVVF